MDGAVHVLQSSVLFASTYGYLAVLLFVFLEDFGMPVPGETVLVAASILAGIGKLDILAVLLYGFVGAVAGDNVGYLIGRYGGRKLVLKYGRYVFITEQRLHKVESFFVQYGGRVVVVARFVSGLRQLNGIIAGIGMMPWHHFLLSNIAGAALWVSVWGGIGYFFGEKAHDIRVAVRISEYYLFVVSIIAAVLLIGSIYIKRRKRKKL